MARGNEDDAGDPLNPARNRPSELDPLTHAEFQRLYEDASANIRFAKQQQWRTVLYFTAGAAIVTAFGQWTKWADSELAFYLLVMIWTFSVISVRDGNSSNTCDFVRRRMNG